MSNQTPFDPAHENELEQTRSELAFVLGHYRREVLDQLEPSPAHRAAMHKMLLGLVTEDVLARRPRASFTILLRGRWQRFCECWSELAAGSLAFRLTSQFALALGVGLVLSVATLASIDSGSRADDRQRLERDEELVPDQGAFDLTIPRDREADNPEAGIPQDETLPPDDPFERGR